MVARQAAALVIQISFTESKSSSRCNVWLKCGHHEYRDTARAGAPGAAAVREANRLTGPAKVIDGDTIVVAGQLVRLHRIDAPELDQMFWWRGRQIACGTMSLAEALTAGLKVRCEVVERDRHGRIVAKVFSPNGVDIGHRLVSAGWALAYRRYSTGYVAAEDEAHKAKRGMWRGSFVKPWVWRASSQGTQAPLSRVVPMSGPRR